MTRAVRLIAVSAVAVVVGACLVACGAGGARDSVVVRVGRSAITSGTLADWMSAMAPEHVVPDPPRFTACIARQRALTLQPITAELEAECRQQYQTLRQQALDFLISSAWLIGEAADQGLAVSDQEVQRRLEEEGGPDGESVADVKVKIMAELAAARLRQTLKRTEPKITPALIARYYAQHIEDFERRERRYFDIVERLPSSAAARGVMREVAMGRSLSTMALHEWLDRKNIADVLPLKKAIVRAIFAAKPHVLIGPTPLNERYAVFEVTRVIPAVVRPLAQVRNAIEKQLADEQERGVLAGFIRTWRAKWIARTDCRPGYVVQKCRQGGGARALEDPYTFN